MGVIKNAHAYMNITKRYTTKSQKGFLHYQVITECWLLNVFKGEPFLLIRKTCYQNQPFFSRSGVVWLQHPIFSPIVWLLQKTIYFLFITIAFIQNCRIHSTVGPFYHVNVWSNRKDWIKCTLLWNRLNLPLLNICLSCFLNIGQLRDRKSKGLYYYML